MRDNHMSWFARKRGLRLLPALGNLFPFGSVYNLYKITYNNYLLFIIYNFPRHAQLQSSIFHEQYIPCCMAHTSGLLAALAPGPNQQHWTLSVRRPRRFFCRWFSRAPSPSRKIAPTPGALRDSPPEVLLVLRLNYSLSFRFCVLLRGSRAFSMEGSSNFHISQFWL